MELSRFHASCRKYSVVKLFSKLIFNSNKQCDPLNRFFSIMHQIVDADGRLEIIREDFHGNDTEMNALLVSKCFDFYKIMIHFLYICKGQLYQKQN